ncbi:MAG: S-layer homology domain-containing protein [Clostridia bacterium]|nr:S-layer homology domain-containing protein [Clostridia bacterium]
MEALPAGSVLYFSGHEMMYLGSENGKYYVVSAVGTVMQPENPSVRQRIRSMVINTLEIKRANGNTWLDNLTVALVPYWQAESSDLPPYTWYHDGVAFCLKNKLMQGDENKFFNPDYKITWAEFLQILWNMEGKPGMEEGSENNQSNWYDDALEWALETKLVYEEDKGFLPDTAITREEVASVLYLYAKYKGLDTNNVEDATIALFDDASEISEYAVSAIEFATRMGIISGKAQNTINPKDNTTRAEIAVILERFSKITQQ